MRYETIKDMYEETSHFVRHSEIFDFMKNMNEIIIIDINQIK